MRDKEKISGLLSKYRLEIGYGDENAPAEFSFVRDDGFFGSGCIDKSTSLKMTEEMAAPILAVIEDVIPYLYDYYYENFPVRKVEAEKIYKRMQEVRLKVFQDPADSSLGKIVERLRWSEFSTGDNDVFGVDNKERNLYKRRYELAALYKFFMMWLRPYPDVYVDFWVWGP